MATQYAAQNSSRPPFAVPESMEMEPNFGGGIIAGVSAPWRKLLLQAEMAAPHVQVASIEGEAGVGKQTLARHLLSRSPLAGASFQRRDAREWLLHEAEVGGLAGFTYLDRVDLLAPPGQGLLLGVLKALQDRPAGRVLLVASSQVSLRQMAGQGAVDARSCLPPDRGAFCCSPPAHAQGGHSADFAGTAGPHLRALPAPPGGAGTGRAGATCCSTPGRATCASWPACWKRRCWKRSTT